MGQELECRMRLGARSFDGKALLESDCVLFRGAERVKLPFADLKRVTAKAGVLRLEFAGGPAELELGNAAERWAEKILHPPSRADKLGIRPGIAVRLVGTFDEDFLEELRARRVAVVERGWEMVFYRAEKAADLLRVPRLAPQGDGALWVVYPKGVETIREMDVIEAGRAAGLKDVKVAKFSATHTGLKFVVPVAQR